MSDAWRIPTDIVDRLTTPFGTAQLVKAKLRGAEFKPEAELTVRGGRYVVCIDFETPIGPEKMDGVVLMLALLPGCAA